jgi:hypothetical protein
LSKQSVLRSWISSYSTFFLSLLFLAASLFCASRRSV